MIMSVGTACIDQVGYLNRLLEVCSNDAASFEGLGCYLNGDIEIVADNSAGGSASALFVNMLGEYARNAEAFQKELQINNILAIKDSKCDAAANTANAALAQSSVVLMQPFC
jgi:hypothetical protein